MTGIFNKDFVEYLELLNKHEVLYVLVGGMAVNLHGYRRTTGDMDIFVDNSERNHLMLKKVHYEFGMHMGEMENLQNFIDNSKFDVFTFGVSPCQIDIMTACKGITFEEAIGNAIHVEIEGSLFIPVVDYKELIKAKNASNRLRDQADIEELDRIYKNKK